jgi:hypothetical protein
MPISTPPNRALATLEQAFTLYADGVRSPTYDELDRSDLVNRRGNRRAQVGDRTGGLADLIEAVRLRGAGAERASAKRLRLALSLNDLDTHEVVDRRLRAVDTLEEAVRILRAQHRRGNVSTYKLVGTLMSFASTLRCADRPDESLDVIKQALAPWKPVPPTASRQDQELLPMMPGMPERRTHDYLRHGVTTVLAALDVATGQVISSIHRPHRATEFKKFLAKLDIWRSPPAWRSI